MLGRYVVLSELGRGGMSVVYVAYDPQLDRRVALKVVRGEQLTEAHRARLHREAQALARLSHPSVVTVFDVGDLADDTFVAMELVDGMSLRQWIKSPRTWREVVKVIVAAGRGLAAAHAAGIVHRDVKPDNIVLGANGGVKLVDFGLARDLGDRSIDSTEQVSSESAHDSDEASSSGSMTSSGSSGSARPLEAITQAGHIVGTPAYMPPEQRGSSVDADERSDQFSLCVTMYEALYRQKPFALKKKDLFDRREQLTVADRPGQDTRTLAAPPPKDTKVPAWLQKVVSRGLAVEPSARYPSVDALLVDLDRDPEKTRLQVALAVGALLAAALVAVLITTKVMPAHHQPTCDNGAQRVAAIWDDRRHAALDAAATRHGAPWASGAIDAFAAQTDRYSNEWKAMYLETCEATRIRNSQSAEAMDLRMACLDRRLAALGALITVMGDADKDALRKAGEVVGNLPPVAECADVKALRQVLQRPTEPAVTAKLDAIDNDLAQLEAFYAVGDTSKTVAFADQVIAKARDTGYAPQLAQSLYWRGRAIADRDGGPEAEAMFDQTFAAALGAGEDQMAADAAARISQEALWAAKLPEFDRWQRVAHALAARSGATGVTGFVDQLVCMSNHYSGKVRTRLTCLRELAKRTSKPSEWLVTTLGIAASEAGEPAESIHWLEQGVELARAENGADHPRTLEMRAYLCRGLYNLGDFARATTECRDSLTRLQKIAPDDHALIARLQWYLGDVEAELHHADVATPLLEAAAAGGDDETKMSARSTLSELGGKHGDARAAIAQHRESLAESVKTFSQYNPHHPNIIADRYELGAALLDHGDVAAASVELTRADVEADPAEMSPLELAQIRFARAKAMVKAKPSDRGEARRLAAEALEIYARHAPNTEKFAKERAAMEAWIAQLDGR
jgi:predicted Ser/Thr protein kinase